MKKKVGQGIFFIFIEYNYEERNNVGFIFTIMLVNFEGRHQ